MEISWRKINGQLKFLNDNILIIGANYLGVDMCGRAVDAQVRFINQINERINLDLLNRNNLAFSKQKKLEYLNLMN